MKKFYPLHILLIVVCSAVTAQTNLDSLYSIWQDPTQSDSTRTLAYKDYIWNGFLFSHPDTAAVMAEELLAFSEERNLLYGQMDAMNIQAVSSSMKNDLKKALELNMHVLSMARKIGDQSQVAATLSNLGIIYKKQGDLPRALDHYQQSLASNEILGNQRGIAISLTNMAIIHRDMGNMEKALSDNMRSLAIVEKLDDLRLISGVLGSIGNVYFKMKNYANALEYQQRCLAINEEIEDQFGISRCLVNIGNIYYEQDDLIPALDYQQRALALQERINDKNGLTKSYNQIGRIRLKQANPQQAIINCGKGLEIAYSLKSIHDQMHNCDCLYNAYKDKGDMRNALKYYENMVLYRDSLFNEENTRKLTQLEMQYDFDKKEAAALAEQEKKDAIVDQELKRQKLARNGFMGGFAVVLLFAGVFFTQRNRIGKEKKRSEELLLNILPEEVADELKVKGETEAKLIDQVTVLFTDFKGFTAMSEMLTPKDLVHDLHECFSAFDQICEKHDLEKIKTIGDSYMAAGGLPTANTTHAEDVVKAALEMEEVVQNGKAKKIANGLPYFEIRIGVHTGPVVAGIVGIKKFQYDIWGDTVNTASRMESSGEVGKVNISAATYEIVKDDFACEYRGELEVKGKGKLGMYFVMKK